MGISYNNGFESVFIPGSSVTTFDTFEHNVANN